MVIKITIILYLSLYVIDIIDEVRDEVEMSINDINQVEVVL